jgi:hypothetical protein
VTRAISDPAAGIVVAPRDPYTSLSPFTTNVISAVVWPGFTVNVNTYPMCAGSNPG